MQKRFLHKRVIALCVAVMMALSMLPVTAFSYGEEFEAEEEILVFGFDEDGYIASEGGALPYDDEIIVTGANAPVWAPNLIGATSTGAARNPVSNAAGNPVGLIISSSATNVISFTASGVLMFTNNFSSSLRLQIIQAGSNANSAAGHGFAAVVGKRYRLEFNASTDAAGTTPPTALRLRPGASGGTSDTGDVTATSGTRFVHTFTFDGAVSDNGTVVAAIDTRLPNGGVLYLSNIQIFEAEELIVEPDGDETVIFCIQDYPELLNRESTGNLGQSETDNFLSGHAGEAATTTVAMAAGKMEISMSGRNGVGQALRFRAETLAGLVIPGHKYRLEYTARSSAATTARIRVELGTGTLPGTGPGALHNGGAAPVNTPFTHSVTFTAEELAQMGTLGSDPSDFATISLSVAEGTSTLTYTHIQAIKICPVNCANSACEPVACNFCGSFDCRGKCNSTGGELIWSLAKYIQDGNPINEDDSRVMNAESEVWESTPGVLRVDITDAGDAWGWRGVDFIVHDLLSVGNSVSITVRGGSGGNAIRLVSEAPWIDGVHGDNNQPYTTTIGTAPNLAAGAEHTFAFNVTSAHLMDGAAYFRVNMALPLGGSGHFFVTNVEITSGTPPVACSFCGNIDCKGECNTTGGALIWSLANYMAENHIDDEGSRVINAGAAVSAEGIGEIRVDIEAADEWGWQGIDFNVHDLLVAGDLVAVTVRGGAGGRNLLLKAEEPYVNEDSYSVTIGTATSLAAGAEHTFSFFVTSDHIANADYFRVSMATNAAGQTGHFFVTKVEVRRSGAFCCADFPDCTCGITAGTKIWELNIVPALAAALNAGTSFEGVGRSGSPTFTVANNQFTVSGRTENWNAIDIPLEPIGVTATGTYRLIVEGVGTTNQLQALFPADGTVAGSAWDWGMVTGSGGLLVMEFDRTIPAGIVLDGAHRIRIRTSGTDNFTITSARIERLTGDGELGYVPISSIAYGITVSNSTASTGNFELNFRYGSWVTTTLNFPMTNGSRVLPVTNFNPATVGFIDPWTLVGVPGSTAVITLDKVIINGIDLMFITPVEIPIGDEEVWYVDTGTGIPTVSWHNRWAGMADGHVIARSADGQFHFAFDAEADGGNGLAVLRTGRGGSSVGILRPDGNGSFTSADLVWLARFLVGHTGVTLTDRRNANIRGEDRAPNLFDLSDLMGLLVGRSLEELLARTH
ncbi:MAG: hypothetical protein FWD19_00885 [Defluviitaleaceae bacterium]|nr:hypothetical protein [Defluviitaleaceae bacterium]